MDGESFMSGSTLGTLFKITNWGESHGSAIGAVIDGCPPQLELSEEDIQRELNRRAPGQSVITTPRKEPDTVRILSGVFNGVTTGTPISLIIDNKNKKKKDYSELEKLFRPGHADFTYQQKYGIRDPYGGGRSSARVTAGTVAGGAIARKILLNELNVEILSYVIQVGDIRANIDRDTVTMEEIEDNIIRCPDSKAAGKMVKLIKEVHKEQDSIGGVVETVIRHVPAGFGEPVYDKLSADLAKGMFTINAVKGFEIGSGFDCASMLGSEHNDPFTIEEGRIITETNNAGGILGGISNGMPIVFRTAFKPTPTIGKRQTTVEQNSDKTEVSMTGRHDPCVLPRAVPVVDAVAALVLCDHYLRFKKFKK